MAVVVVESPAKAKTINKYLGSGYIVLASVGHVRDLASKDGAVDPKRDFSMRWEIDSNKQKNIKAIADALVETNKLILATDPDREGEAISWHLLEVLQKKKVIGKSTVVERVVFNAITKTAILDAMKMPRNINMPLVEAYLARRALDHLVGFNLSPVLWRKLPGAKSAGRVQSVSLKLIVEREMEIEAFQSEEYWSVDTVLTNQTQESFAAKLVRCNGTEIKKMTLKSEKDALEAKREIQKSNFSVGNVVSSPKKRNPAPPFMTSTLQQESSRKLGLGAKETMIAAQRLYEAGLITYMRTDGIDMAPEASKEVRELIISDYGIDYAPSQPRVYKNVAKNAQEAHECIRPTDITRVPRNLAELDKVQSGLYSLIWRRTIASQMESARFETTTANIQNLDNSTNLRASGQVLLFDGFLKVYVEGRDEEKNKTDEESTLPALKKKETLEIAKIETLQHFTQPAARYTEATLVKKMEDLGIGRPSTYASIVTTIQDREYVKKDKNRLIPEDKGRLVTVFLNNYFNKYLEYDYTAELEKKLDRISAGEENWKNILGEFWVEFEKAIGQTADLRISEVLEKLNEVLAPHIFPDRGDGSDPRVCQSCQKGRLSIKTARSGGAFIGCSSYPDCNYTRALNEAGDGSKADKILDRELGKDHEGLSVFIRSGRFGPYVQLGETTPEKAKPHRVSIPQGMIIETIDLHKALQLLALPRKIGLHPDDGMQIEAAVGRYGPYVKHGRTYANLKDPEEVLAIGMNRALELIQEKINKPGNFSAAKILKSLGEHPDNGPIEVMDGKYGPYVRWRRTNATLPKSVTPDSITFAQALELINEKVTKKSANKKRKT